MLDVPSGLPLQVEVNTVSTSFMSLSTRVQQMHRHVIRWGGLEASYGGGGDGGVDPSEANGALELAADTLAAGWRAAGDEGAKLLMVVQPGERNIFDQRLIAQRLWDAHGVRTTRATLAGDCQEARVRDDDDATLTYRGERHSVVYYRAGYSPRITPRTRSGTRASSWNVRAL